MHAGLTVMHMCHSAAMLRCLHERTRTPIDTAAPDGQSPLMHAVRRGEMDVVSEALACGADISHVDNMHRNALHIACEHVRSRPPCRKTLPYGRVQPSAL